MNRFNSHTIDSPLPRTEPRLHWPKLEEPRSIPTLWEMSDSARDVLLQRRPVDGVFRSAESKKEQS